MSRKNDIIKKEMAYNRFRPIRIPGVSYDVIVSEIANCLYAERHEQTIVPTGVLFCRNDISTSDDVQIRDMKISIDDLRTLADGRRTFLAYSGNADPKLAVLKEAVSDEMRLLKLSLNAGGIATKRDGSGTVRIAQRGELWRVEDRRWEHKPPFYEHLYLIQQCLGTAPNSLYFPLSSLLRLTYYFLSSRNVGTTLVWRVEGTAKQTLKGLSKQGLDVRDLELTLVDESSYPVIEHLLNHKDGAAIIDPSGTVEHLGAHLMYGDDATKRIPAENGTRHTSAKRFSYDHSETVVFVVSQDGPVSVYSDGYKVTEMFSELASNVSENLKKMVPGKSEDVENYTVDIMCHQCGRCIRVEQVIVLGWKEREKVDCPCCQAKAIYSSMCWSLSAWPVKFPTGS